MARYNEILVGRYNRYLQKLFAIKGQPPSPQVASDIQPSLAMMEGVENRYLQSWERFTNVNIVAAVAASNGAIRLRNPVGSNVIAVVEKILVVNPNAVNTAPELQITRVDPGDLGTLIGSSPAMDSRGRPSSTLILSQAAPGASLGFVLARVLLTQTVTNWDYIITENQEVTMLPGTAVEVRDTVVNTIVQWNLIWRERALEESERT